MTTTNRVVLKTAYGVDISVDTNNGRWYCTTHREGFPNQFQKDTHIHTGKHRMAWVCFTHGIEVP